MLGLSIREVARQLRDGRLSATELCSRCIERARRCRELNAVVTERFEEGLEDAKKIQEKLNKGASIGPLAGIPLAVKDNYSTARFRTSCGSKMLESASIGPLAGIPLAVKDNYSTARFRTSCGSKMLENYSPPFTATVVERLQDAGAIMMGKTNLDEFAMGSGCTESLFGPTRNIWRYPFHRVQKQRSQNAGGTCSSEDDDVDSVGDSDWFVSGGSSGGSGVAVASGSCMAALGSDTGGSVRLPASFCGVVGLKPTYGLCSRHGLISLVNSLDVPGIFTKTVDDTATVLGAMAGHDPMDSTTVTDPFTPFTLPDEIDVKGLHIGIPQEYHAPGLSEDVLVAWSNAANVFENAGAKVSPISLPNTQYSIAVYSVLNTVEVASNMARYDGIEYGHRSSKGRSTEELYALSRHEGFLDTVRGRILAGNYFLLEKNYERYFLHAQRVRRLIAQDFQNVFESGVDVIVTPTTISDSPTYAEFCEVDTRTQAERQDIFTQPVNLAGLPAVVVPAMLSSRGLPIGIQLIGKTFQDQALLTVAKWFEQQVQFPHHIIEDYFADSE